MPYTRDLFPMPLFDADAAPRLEHQRELADADPSNVFGAVIHRYTRAQAIEDGVLVDLSGDAGDLTGLAEEAGFRVPVAMTRAAFNAAVWPIEDDAAAAWLTSRGQDPKGRAWDVLSMLSMRSRTAAGAGGLVLYRLSVVRHDVTPRGRRTLVLKAVIGGGDDGEPVITIMLREED